MFLDFSDIRLMFFGIFITAIVLTVSVMKKKSIFSGSMLIFFVILLVVHVISMSSSASIIADLVGVGACITTYLIVDEVEIRRKKINQVFEDRYKS